MLMRALDQYRKGLTPVRRCGRTRRTFDRRRRPTTATTTGAANARTLRDGTPAPVTGHGSDDKTGVMSFFTAGVETVSDNGKTNAQQFAHVRPFEGRVSGYYPSRTTLRGSQFAPWDPRSPRESGDDGARARWLRVSWLDDERGIILLLCLTRGRTRRGGRANQSSVLAWTSLVLDGAEIVVRLHRKIRVVR